VPVISSLALGFDGEYYNVNADQMASACAVACGANALIYLTDVAGVKDAEGTVIRWLDVHKIGNMVEKATVSGGMLPKLEACTSALKKGVTRVRILPAERAEVLPGFFTQKIDYGTEVIVSN
jgi:acetylglutamate kinase